MKLAFLLLLLPAAARAEAPAARTFSQANSLCRVEASAGEYPTCTVLRGTATLYFTDSPFCGVAISSSGAYVAIASGPEGLLLAATPRRPLWGLVIVNCGTGAVAGYHPALGTRIKAWKGDDVLTLEDELTFGPNSLSLP